jgi:hypothetical protein
MYIMTIRTDRQLVHFRFRDNLTIPGFRRAFLDFVESPEFDPQYLILIDIREVTEITADFKGIFNAVQGLSQIFTKFERGALCVLLVNGDLHFGMARMLQQIVEVFSKIRIQPVRDLAEASVHSGLAPDDLADILAQGRAPMGTPQP